MIDIFYQACGSDNLGRQVQRIEQTVAETGAVLSSTRTLVGRAATPELAATIAAGLNKSRAFHERAGGSPPLFSLVERSYFPRGAVVRGPVRQALALA